MSDLEQRWREAERDLRCYMGMCGTDLASMMISSESCHRLAQRACLLVMLQCNERIAARSQPAAKFPADQQLMIYASHDTGQPGEERIKTGGMVDELDENPQS